MISGCKMQKLKSKHFFLNRSKTYMVVALLGFYREEKSFNICHLNERGRFNISEQNGQIMSVYFLSLSYTLS